MQVTYLTTLATRTLKSYFVTYTTPEQLNVLTFAPTTEASLRGNSRETLINCAYSTSARRSTCPSTTVLPNNGSGCCAERRSRQTSRTRARPRPTQTATHAVSDVVQQLATAEPAAPLWHGGLIEKDKKRAQVGAARRKVADDGHRAKPPKQYLPSPKRQHLQNRYLPKRLVAPRDARGQGIQ